MKRNRGWIMAVGGIVLLVAVMWAGPYLNPHRYIDAVTAVPVNVEVSKGTDIAFRHTMVGRVDSLGAARWGLETAYRLHDALHLWQPATLFDRTTAGAGRAPAVSVELGQSPAEIVLAIQQGPTTLRFIRRDGAWIDSISPSRSAVAVNGKRPKSDVPALRLLPGDYLGLDGVDLRIGRFLKLTPVYLRFTTGKLCPLRGVAKRLPWRPDSAERSACAARTVRGTAQLSLAESFGLTKPVLKLIPSEGEPAIVATDSFIVLAPRTDIQAEVEQMLAYLNAPVTSRPEPNTHFEYSVTNADSMVRTITRAARGLESTTTTLNEALHSPDGLSPVILGTESSEFLRQTLANTAGLTGRLADPSGTLLQNVGLEPAVSNASRTIAHADTTIDLVRAQVLRLTPRMELAADQVTNSLEGVQGTLQSVKTATEDISQLKNGVTSAPGKVTLGLIVLGSLASLVAHIKYIR
jgi:hypothetical protein